MQDVRFKDGLVRTPISWCCIKVQSIEFIFIYNAYWHIGTVFEHNKTDEVDKDDLDEEFDEKDEFDFEDMENDDDLYNECVNNTKNANDENKCYDDDKAKIIEKVLWLGCGKS